MVAYSFKKQFVPMIEAGTKRQTIRADRKRHARPGEMLQLYVGMRTRQCRKIRPDAPCISVQPIRIVRTCFELVSVDLTELAEPLTGDLLLNEFAKMDGFKDHFEMARFWSAQHSRPEVGKLDTFSGVLIKWYPTP